MSGTNVINTQNNFYEHAVWESRILSTHSSENPDLLQHFQDDFFKSMRRFPTLIHKEVLKGQRKDMRQSFTSGIYTLNIYKESGVSGYILSREGRGDPISQGEVISKGARKFVRKSVGLKWLLQPSKTESI